MLAWVAGEGRWPRTCSAFVETGRPGEGLRIVLAALVCLMPGTPSLILVGQPRG